MPLVELLGFEMPAFGCLDYLSADQLLDEIARRTLGAQRGGGRRCRILADLILAIDPGDLPPQLRQLFLNVHSPFLCPPPTIVGR